MFKTEVEKMNGIVFGDEGKPFSAWGLQFVTLFHFLHSCLYISLDSKAIVKSFIFTHRVIF